MKVKWDYYSQYIENIPFNVPHHQSYITRTTWNHLQQFPGLCFRHHFAAVAGISGQPQERAQVWAGFETGYSRTTYWTHLKSCSAASFLAGANSKLNRIKHLQHDSWNSHRVVKPESCLGLNIPEVEFNAFTNGISSYSCRLRVFRFHGG